MTSKDSSRPYRKKKRALQQEETRRRITEAAVELHGTLGPARSGVTDIAKRAGVTRMTVYNHFPADVDLFMACSTHWVANNPFPQPSVWAEIEDPAERLVVALRDLYGWYRGAEDMLGNVLRDAATITSLAAVMEELWWPYLQGVVGVLAHGWASGAAQRKDLVAALRLAVDFDTWRSLTSSGLKDQRAADLAARMVAASVGGRRG